MNNGAFRVDSTCNYKIVSPNNLSTVATCNTNAYVNINWFSIYADKSRRGNRARTVHFNEEVNHDDMERTGGPAQTNTVSSNSTRTSVLQPSCDSRGLENGLDAQRREPYRQPSRRNQGRLTSRDDGPDGTTRESGSFWRRSSGEDASIPNSDQSQR